MTFQYIHCRLQAHRPSNSHVPPCPYAHRTGDTIRLLGMTCVIRFGNPDSSCFCFIQLRYPSRFSLIHANLSHNQIITQCCMYIERSKQFAIHCCTVLWVVANDWLGIRAPGYLDIQQPVPPLSRGCGSAESIGAAVWIFFYFYSISIACISIQRFNIDRRMSRWHRHRTHKYYQIGIICGLATEKAAMVAMLYETHPKL